MSRPDRFVDLAPAGSADIDCATCKVRCQSVCAALEPVEWQEFERVADTAVLPPGTTLFTQGDAAGHVHTVTAGTVRLYKLLPDGRRQIVGFALPGDFLGLALDAAYGLSADAVDEVTVCRFSRRIYTGLVDAKPHLLRRLHRFATHELTLAQEQMTLLGRRSAEEKLASFVLGLRRRQGAVQGRESVTVTLPMSRQDIADFLGLTIETVSRTFTRLAKARALMVVPDGVRVLDLDLLEATAAD